MTLSIQIRETLRNDKDNPFYMGPSDTNDAKKPVRGASENFTPQPQPSDFFSQTLSGRYPSPEQPISETMAQNRAICFLLPNRYQSQEQTKPLPTFDELLTSFIEKETSPTTRIAESESKAVIFKTLSDRLFIIKNKIETLSLTEAEGFEKIEETFHKDSINLIRSLAKKEREDVARILAHEEEMKAQWEKEDQSNKRGIIDRLFTAFASTL